MTETAERSAVETIFVETPQPRPEGVSNSLHRLPTDGRRAPDRTAAAISAVEALESRLAGLAATASTLRTALNYDPIANTQSWIRDRLDAIPLPGQGHTALRWRALAAVGAYDLDAAKLYESHTDAIAILAELAPEISPPPGMGAVWAAENGTDRLLIDGDTVRGRKPWCSGAHLADWALVTAWPVDTPASGRGARVLALVNVRAAGIATDSSGWHAVGMAATRTATVTFDAAPVTVIGKPDAYLHRPGFWHGGAGIAAMWYGAATAIGATVALSAKGDPYKTMHLGIIDGLLTSSRALLVEAAHHIDAAPEASSQVYALRTRTVLDDAARRIIDHAARALGAGPLCQDAAFAKRMSDLPVFLRQSHAERDLAALGAHLIDSAIPGVTPWRL
jgi:hypothetical protein